MVSLLVNMDEVGLTAKDATISWKYTHQPSSLQALFIRQIKHFNEPTLLKQRLIQLRKIIEQGDADEDILHKFLVTFEPPPPPPLKIPKKPDLYDGTILNEWQFGKGSNSKKKEI